MPVSKKRKSAPRKGGKIPADIVRGAQSRLRREELPFSHPMNAPMLDKVFGPIENAIVSIEKTGDVHAHEGEAVFYNSDDQVWYPMAPAFRELCETYDLIAADLKAPSPTEGLRRLANKLHYGMMLDEKDTGPARASVASMRQMTRAVTPKMMRSFMTTTQIGAEFRAKGLAEAIQ